MGNRCLKESYTRQLRATLLNLPYLALKKAYNIALAII
jgi:hypothetical protein